jgi:thymidylate kinase
MIRTVVGIEGPVLAGKTTVIGALCSLLKHRGVDCTAVPCFVQAALDLGMTLPPAVPKNPDEELEAVRFFVSVDQRRRPLFAPGVIFLDRTLWTLLAHNMALARTHRLDAVAKVQDYLRRTNLTELMPNHLIYLDVSHTQQLARARERAALPEPFLDPEFNMEFRAFFQRMASEHNAHWVNADEQAPVVADRIDCLLSQFLGRDHDQK